MKWPCLDAGELRHQITILQPFPTTDISGAAMEMVPFLTAYAKIDVQRGTDVVQGGQVTPQISLAVWMWWQAGITSSMQIQALNGIYIIRAIENVSEMNLVMKLDCIELSGS
jgi:head-tail adaptor